MMITIRKAVEQDIQAMLDIYNDIIKNTTAVFHYDQHTFEMRKEWFEQRQKENFPVFIAEENNKVVGFSTFGSFRPWKAYQYTVENSVYVKAEERGKGIAKLLMQPLIDAAKERQLHTIIAVITSDNAASIALHKQFGFTEAGYFKEVGYKFDRWLDLVFMQLIL